MNNDTPTRPISLYALFGAIAFQGISGVVGGIALIIDPTGELLGLPLSWLRDSPFGSYLVPGIILFLILGIVPLLVLPGIWKRRQWAWLLSLFIGVALAVWIVVEIMIIGFHPQPPLQQIYGILAVVIIVLTFSKSVRQYFGRH